MSNHPSYDDEYSPSHMFPRQFTKKHDLIQKIQKLGIKPKNKYNFSQVNQSPRSPSTNNYQHFQIDQDFYAPRSPKPSQHQNDIINNLKQELLNIKQDVSKLMGKQKERNKNITQSIKNQRIFYSPNYDNQSIASQNVNMYRYKSKQDGFRLRSQQPNKAQEEQISLSGIDGISEVPSYYRKKQTYYKPKYLSPKISTMDYIDIDKSRERGFRKSPKIFQREVETSGASIRNNVYQQQLAEAQRTIKYLQGVIEDSNTIRKGLQTKISSMKKIQLNSNSQQCRILRQKLSRQQHNRVQLQQKIVYLTQQIQNIQQQLISPRTNINHSRILQQQRSIEIYESKIKNLIESHNRQLFGLKTQNKLHKLNLQKYQQKQKAQKVSFSPKKQNKLAYSQSKISIMVRPLKKILSLVTIQMQTDISQQYQTTSQTNTQQLQINKECIQCKTNKLKQIQMLQHIKQQINAIQKIKICLQSKNTQLQSQNYKILSNLQSLTKQYKQYKQSTSHRIKQISQKQKALNNQLIANQNVLKELSYSLSSSQFQLKQVTQEKSIILRQIQKQKSLNTRQKSQNSSQLKISQSIINQLNAKIIHFQQQIKSIESRHRQQKQQSKNQIKNYILQNRRLSELYAQKCKLTQSNSSKMIIDSDLQQKNQQLQIRNQKLQSQLEQIQYKHKQEIMSIKQTLKYNKQLSAQSIQKGFDQQLKRQLFEISSLKAQIEEKKQLIIQLKQQCRSLRTLADNNRAELQIEKLRSISQRKNLSISYQIQIQNIKNQLQYQKKISNSFNTKLKLLNQQNKRKDEFLQKYILGKNINQQFKIQVIEFFRRYQQQFNVDKLKQRVYEETEVIQKLMEDNKVLIRNICQLRQEAMRNNYKGFVNNATSSNEIQIQNLQEIEGQEYKQITE